MSQIEIRCVDQTAMFTNLPEIFSGDVNIDTVKFTFDDSWNGYTTKTAVFYNNPKDVYPTILDVNDVAVIPSQVMTKECKLSIGVFGTKANGDVKTSKILTYNVGKGAINSDLESTPATPDFWTQLLARQINFENNINSTVDTFKTTVNSTVDTFKTTVNSKVDGLEKNVETVEAIAKGRNQALAYNSYSEMITALNGMTKDELKRGQNIYIGTVGVPDLWVYSVETTKSTYSYTNDETFVNSLNNNVTVKVGYYKLAQLETQKVDVGGINADINSLRGNITTLQNTPICVFTNESYSLNESVSTLPYNFYGGCAVVYNNEIHILGGSDSSNYTKHYKWNGSSWVTVSTLPYPFYRGCAVVYNNEIHILGTDSSNSSSLKFHYKWNGSSWVTVSTLPYDFANGCAVVYNNEIHILGSNNGSTKHYKWNGSSWTSVSTLPYNFANGCAVVYNNEIHIMGTDHSSDDTKHYKYNGSSWTNVSTLPYNFRQGSAVVYNNEIHIMGSGDASYNSIYRTSHYKIMGDTKLSGYAKANTKLYLPQISYALTDNLEKITDGYRVTEDGYVEILI